MKSKRIVTAFLTLITFVLMAIPVSANSSWHWISKTRPLDVLPIIIAVTLLIEILSILKISKINKSSTVVFIVVLGNCLSFAAPFLFELIGRIIEPMSVIYSFSETLEHTPFYIIGISYLIMTLIIEIPIEYNFLKKKTNNKKKLALTILIVNVITTVLAVITERTICQGSL